MQTVRNTHNDKLMMEKEKHISQAWGHAYNPSSPEAEEDSPEVSLVCIAKVHYSSGYRKTVVSKGTQPIGRRRDEWISLYRNILTAIVPKGPAICNTPTLT